MFGIALPAVAAVMAAVLVDDESAAQQVSLALALVVSATPSDFPL